MNTWKHVEVPWWEFRPHLISLTLGSGCITTIFFLATVMMWGVKMNWPKHCNRKTRALLDFSVLTYNPKHTKTICPLCYVYLRPCTPPQTQTSPFGSSSCRGRRSQATLPLYCQTPPASSSTIMFTLRSSTTTATVKLLRIFAGRDIWFVITLHIPPPHLFDALWGHVADNLCRHVQVLWSHVTQSDAVLSQQFGEWMNRAAVFQISDHSYL